MARVLFCALGLLAALAGATPIVFPEKNVTLGNTHTDTRMSSLAKHKNVPRQFTAEIQPQTSIVSVNTTATEMPAQTSTQAAVVPTALPTTIGNTTGLGLDAISAALSQGGVSPPADQGGTPPLNLSALYDIIFSGKNVLVKNEPTGQKLEPQMGPAAMPAPGSGGDNQTREAAVGAGGPSGPGGRIMQALFNRPLNHTQYYERNWMWIRCRTQMSTKFDVGGGWVRDHGRNWNNFLNRQCLGVVNWKFDYANGQGWGDAQVSFDFFFPGCTIQHAVRAAIDASRAEAEANRRELYVYSCPGFDSEPWSFKEMERGQGGAYDPTYQNPAVPPALTQQQIWFGVKDPSLAG